MIDPFSAVSIASSGITVTTSPDYLLDALTACYVLLTLALAFIAFRSLRQTQSSLDLTRQQIELNTQQSQEASAASERHSQATIDAVNKQIAASEVQSNAAIEAINRQIAASQQQAQEALYNQHKPVVVPISEKIEESRTPKGVAAYRVGMQNKGAGVALNAFGVLGIKGLPAIYCSSKIWFLVPDNEEPFTFKVRGEVMFPFNVFEEVNIFPQVGARLMITYNDAFSNKYFAVFDYSEELGWKQVHEIRRVKERLDELLIIRLKNE